MVLFPQGKVHMLQNSGTEEMKVICFFAPPSDLGTYKFFKDVDFPSEPPRRGRPPQSNDESTRVADRTAIGDSCLLYEKSLN